MQFNPFGDLDREILREVEHDIFEFFGISTFSTNSEGCPKFWKYFSEIDGVTFDFQPEFFEYSVEWKGHLIS